MATTKRRGFGIIWNLVLAAALLAGCGGAQATVVLPKKQRRALIRRTSCRPPWTTGRPWTGAIPAYRSDYDLVGESDTLRSI